MPETTAFPPGTFCWADSGTLDAARAEAFYAALFGWDYIAADDTGYTMCLKGGQPVAGLYPLSRELVDGGAGSYWLPYVAVADADATIRRVAAAGGHPLDPVIDVPGHGRAGAFFDPGGALCGLFQPGGHPGFGRSGEHGTVSWCELQTPDPEAAAGFYAAVFDWSREAVPLPGGPYHVFKNGETPSAGMMALTPAMGAVPPNWTIYFHVDDADVAIAAASRAGGEIVVPVMVIGNASRMAVLRSADGAYFSILEPGPMA